MRYFILLFLLVSASHLHGQSLGQERIDSLLKALPGAKNDTVRVNILYDLALSYNDINGREGLKYGLQGNELAQKMAWKKGIGKTYLTIGVDYGTIGELSLSTEYLLKSLKIYEDLNEPINQGIVYLNLGNTANSMSANERALDYYMRALNLFKKEKNEGLASFVSGNIADLYNNMGDYNKSLEFSNAALKYAEAKDDKISVGRIYINIGVSYSNLKEYTKALVSERKAMAIFKALGVKRYLANSLTNIGNNYYLAVTDSTVAMPPDLMAMGKKAALDTALTYCMTAVEIAKETGDLAELSITYEDIAKINEVKGDYKAAFENYKLHSVFQDSMLLKSNNEKVLNMEHKREMDIKDKQVQLASLTATKRRNESFLLLAGVAGLLVVIMVVIRERRKSDKLLLNILPATVARELKLKGRSAAHHFDNVTVLFTDFVNFTSSAEKMKPQDLVDQLDMYFKAFDQIIGKYRIEKIKTVGDAYLAVAGLPSANPAHATDMIAAAMEIMEFVNKEKALKNESAFDMRIGIHSGSVVAGIVGVKKFAYDIWGDTVNTAARMEQNGVPGQINISQATYELVKDSFTFSYRGQIEAKNKGKLGMYLVFKQEQV